MTKTVYSYDRATGEYLGEAVAQPNPRRPGAYLLPAFSTETAPPAAGEHEAAVYREGAWSIVPDWRGHIYWLADGSRHEITELGVEPPDEALDEPPLPSLEEAKAQRIQGIKREAHSVLQPTDWYVVRHIEIGEPIPSDIVAYRAAVRAASDAAEADVMALTDPAVVLTYQVAWPTSEPLTVS